MADMYGLRDKSRLGAGLDSGTSLAISHAGPLFPGCPVPGPAVSKLPNATSPHPVRGSCLSRCYTKVKGLAVNGQDLKKMYLVANRVVNRFLIVRSRKTRGEKMQDSLAMLLKTNGGKMSVYGLLAMLMKICELYVLSRDVEEI